MNEFDEFELRQKVEQWELIQKAPAQANLWQKISKDLKPKTNIVVLWKQLGIAAALLLVIGCSIFWFTTHESQSIALNNGNFKNKKVVNEKVVSLKTITPTTTKNVKTNEKSKKLQLPSKIKTVIIQKEDNTLGQQASPLDAMPGFQEKID